MKTSHYTIRGHALVVLHEVNLTYLFFKFALAEALEEISASITKYLWFDDDYTIKFCLYNFHLLLASEKRCASLLIEMLCAE